QRGAGDDVGDLGIEGREAKEEQLALVEGGGGEAAEGEEERTGRTRACTGEAARGDGRARACRTWRTGWPLAADWALVACRTRWPGGAGRGRGARVPRGAGAPLAPPPRRAGPDCQAGLAHRLDQADPAGRPRPLRQLDPLVRPRRLALSHLAGPGSRLAPADR